MLLKTKEVAARLRCCNNHILMLIQKGKLIAHKDGKGYLISENSLQSYLASIETKGESDAAASQK